MVERLGGELAGVIDAHECRALALLRSAELASPCRGGAGDGSRGPGRREHRSQGTIKGGDRIV
jgi:hypothetical protein